jgi:fucose permease
MPAPDIERRVRRQLDYKILPMICFFMFVSFLDRGNIGNAKIQGMTQQLHMKGNDYNIAVMLFTVAYIVFGLPASLIFKKTGPQSLSVMMFLWGIVVEIRKSPAECAS